MIDPPAQTRQGNNPKKCTDANRHRQRMGGNVGGTVTQVSRYPSLFSRADGANPGDDG
jgi:hypothetical protein